MPVVWVMIGAIAAIVIIVVVVPLIYKFVTQFLWVRLWNLNPDADWIIVQDQMGHYYVCDNPLEEKPRWIKHISYSHREDVYELKELRFSTVQSGDRYKHSSLEEAHDVIRQLCNDFPQTAAILDINEIKASP